GEFPGVVRLGPRAVAWMQSEVIKWIDSKASAR
ncbi:helix-turn-helix transcriptional regulator, partial [Aeromonas caviae]